MKSSFKKQPSSIIDLEVSLDSKEFNVYWQTIYDRALENVAIKGFRPGAAPRELADKAIDKEAVFHKAAEEAVRASLNELSEDNHWTIIDQTKIELTEADPEKGLKYKAELTVFPEIELGNYKKIAKKVFSEKQPVKVEPEEIEKSLEWLRQSRAKLTRGSRPSERGDLVEASIESFTGGKLIQGGKLDGDRFILGESRFLPGFDDQLVNHKEGEILNFSLTAPADYWQKDLQGRQIDFKIKIRGVFKRELAELNDDFAKGLGSNFQTLEAVKTSIKQGIEAEKQDKERERLRLKIIEEVIKTSKIDLPKIMIEKTLGNMISETKAMMAGNTKFSYSDEEFKKQLEPRARERVLANLVMHKIAQIEHLEPTEEEIKAEAKVHNLDLKTYYDYTWSRVRNRKLFEFLERQ